MTEGDAALGEIVGRKFEGDFIARQNADAISAEPAGEVREHEPFVLKLHAEFAAGEFLDDCALYFYTVFFTHSVRSVCLLYFFSYRCGAGRAAW